MAQIYTKGSEQTLVLNPREAVCRKFDFGTDWTEIRLGMYVAAVNSSGPNADATTETLTPSGITDYLVFGIKDSSTALPGQTGSTFLGVRSSGNTVVSSSLASGISDSSGAWKTAGYYDTNLVISASNIFSSTGWGRSAVASAATGYNTFFGIKIVINNRGLATQTVDVSAATTQPVTGSAYTSTALRTDLNNASYSAAQNIAWNDGAAARAIPDSFYVRVPLFLNSIRLSAIRAIRYAP